MNANKLSGSYWLSSWEQEEVCEILEQYELLKYDNKRGLPLSAGGFTDVYINLRDERNYPEATRLLAEVYANPLRRLMCTEMAPNLFAEVASSMSGIAGELSVITGLPRITIREIPKEGRVSKANVIGRAEYGEICWGVEDVTTSGASLIRLYQECAALGLQVPGAIVLVDRQQGWEQKFQKENIPMVVWAGMTLHHVRKWLIENRRMERCDPSIEEKSPIIVALDGKDWKEVLPIIDPLRTTGCILKINDLLIEEGLGIVSDLQVYGRVLLDLKGHDIPNTLENICNRILRLPLKPWGVIIHASGGEAMMKIVVEKIRGSGIKVFAVTVLTSLDENTCEEIYHRWPLEQVRILAAIAVRAGVDGFICSPQEVKELSTVYPDKICITPGIRSVGSPKDDQERIATPAAAMANGANYLVVGRQITGALDPISEVKKILAEISGTG